MILIYSIFSILLSTISCREDFFTELIQNQKYNWEIVLFALILFLIYYSYLGNQQNKSVVKQFFEHSINIFKVNFYHVGLKLDEFEKIDLNVEKLIEDSNIVEQDTANFYRVYLTGRENLRYCILSLNTKRRQDFLISTIYSIISPEKDRVLLECALPEDWSEKGLLYIIQKSKLKQMIQDYEDLRTLCKSYSVQNLNQKKIKILAESNETIESVIDKNVQETLNQCQDLLESLELSDCYENPLSKGNTFKMVVSLGKLKKDDFQKVNRLLEMFFYIIDKLQLFTPNQKTLEKFQQNRMNLKSKQKKVELEEHQNNLREEKLKNMSETEKEKYKERQLRKQKNKMAKRVKNIARMQLIILQVFIVQEQLFREQILHLLHQFNQFDQKI